MHVLDLPDGGEEVLEPGEVASTAVLSGLGALVDRSLLRATSARAFMALASASEGSISGPIESHKGSSEPSSKARKDRRAPPARPPTRSRRSSSR